MYILFLFFTPIIIAAAAWKWFQLNYVIEITQKEKELLERENKWLKEKLQKEGKRSSEDEFNFDVDMDQNDAEIKGKRKSWSQEHLRGIPKPANTKDAINDYNERSRIKNKYLADAELSDLWEISEQ